MNSGEHYTLSIDGGLQVAIGDWFRKTTWSRVDEEDFETRLGRARHASRAQYLRIQAVHLAEAGLHREALGLLDRLLSEYPTGFELSIAHNLRACCLEAVGELEAAVRAFRASLAAQVQLRGAGTRSPIEFPLFIARHRVRALYDEARELLEAAVEGFFFKTDEFEIGAARALIAHDRGERAVARAHARAALEVAGARRSGLRYHPDVGLVPPSDPLVEEMRVLAE